MVCDAHPTGFYENRKSISVNAIRNTQYESLLFHQLYEIIKKIARIVWAGGGFGVVLDGEGRHVFAAEALVRIVVEVEVR